MSSSTTNPESQEIDTSSLPSTFLNHWLNHPNPTALPFPEGKPPFPLTAIDYHQLTLTDADYTPHTWSNLTHLIDIHELDALKRWPSHLRAYLAWYAHIKSKYASITEYILTQRLRWHPLSSTGAFVFEIKNSTPFADPADYKILRNDWSYGMEPGIEHFVVWVKQRLPVDGKGDLTAEGREMVEEFVEREFRRTVGEEERGSKVLWFKNSTDLQSVRSLEHVHVLVRGVGEEVLERWRN